MPTSRRLWFLLLCLVFGAAVQAHADTTFTVNSTDSVADGTCDGAHCSLDDAIVAANATPGTDTIAFAILPGGGTHTLTRATALPPITEAVTIDGYTQTGSQANTVPLGPLDTIIRIELQATTPAVGNGLRIEASNVTIRGLAIANFANNISVSDTSTAVAISGNFIGTAADGLTAMGSTNGVACDLCAGLTVGGANEAARNLISGNAGAGVRTSRPAGSTPVILTIRGNLIGPNKTITAALGNGIGIYLHTPSTGSAAGDRVAIGGASFPGNST